MTNRIITFRSTDTGYELRLLLWVIGPVLAGMVLAGWLAVALNRPGEMGPVKLAIPLQAECGDGECSGDENADSCPEDCGGGGGPTCGDGSCDAGEDASSCPDDCGGGGGPFCGDGSCDPGEDSGNCPGDCGGGNFCGDGKCDSDEDPSTCPDDCGGGGGVCGDGTCDPGEDSGNCPGDCGGGNFCGDGKCDSDEDPSTCPDDCEPGGGFCGDGICDAAAGEDPSWCADDCGEGPFCGDGSCDADASEDAATCPDDCAYEPVCGDGYCDADAGEDPSWCADDCGDEPSCGDGECGADEDADSCPDDCEGDGSVCGDGECDGDEDADTCPDDCQGDEPVCGDDVCDEDEEEDCPEDCDSGDGTPASSEDATPESNDLTVTPTVTGDDAVTPTATADGSIQDVQSLPTPTPLPKVVEQEQPNCRFVPFDDLPPDVQAAFEGLEAEFEDVTPAWMVCERMPREVCIPLDSGQVAGLSDPQDELRLLNCTRKGDCTIHRVRRYADGQACGRAGRLRELTCLEGCTVVLGRLAPSLTAGTVIPIGVAIGLVGGAAGVVFVAMSKGKREIDEEYDDLLDSDLTGGQ